ncbi:hypothetical protein N658DRAFT_565110 [Parathielavia hyrcaniae]|uniref:Aminoglycoside phosphotransferase domain-containing protein n=1 Tax=Parathielavia hyrcaniae TaxID=113614 RepID=A0AAN6T4Z4_9PEZI|nr:hypothetical protein N658DRAFT_565110 [Parathielavia hyrcaniae]
MSLHTGQKPKALPSARWALETVLVRHAELITGQKFSISKPFSAGQYWLCLELVEADGSLIIARVRLPRHPDMPSAASDEDELYSIACEVVTMQFVRRKLPAVTVPHVYAYEGPGSQRAADSGAMYMLLEGFYGNTLQDVAPDMCRLPVIQAEVATMEFPHIGSICSVSEDGEPVIGRLSTAPAEGLANPGPFSSAAEYFTAVGEAALSKPDFRVGDPKQASHSPPQLGPLVFLDIVQKTTLFADDDHPGQPFPLNHMDLGTQNILVDDAFHFLAVIDWEFAQTAPWQVNHYPMPFPLLSSEQRNNTILRDPDHIAHGNVSRQAAARHMYARKFREAEERLCAEQGRVIGQSFACVLDGAASKVYGRFTRLRGIPEYDDKLVREMLRLGLGLDGEEAERYLAAQEEKSLRQGGG